MSARHGAKAKLWVAQYELSGFSNVIESHYKNDLVDVSVQGQVAPLVKNFLPGLINWTKTNKGFYDGDVDQLDDILTSLLNTETQVIIAPAGAPEGGIAKASRGALQDTWNISSPVNGAVAFDASWMGNYLFTRTKILRQATLATTGNGSAYDLGAAGTQGVEGFLVVTAFDGTDATIKIQTSADGSTGWADRVTFTQVTAPTFERKTGGTSVDQYHRVAVTGTFNSITLLVVSHNIGEYEFAAE